MNVSIDIAQYSLKSTSFYEMISKDEREYVQKHEQIKEYKKGQELFREGSHAKGVYIILSGKVKITSSSFSNIESIIYIYQKNDFLGHRPLLTNETYAVSAVALENTQVSFIPGDVFI